MTRLLVISMAALALRGEGQTTTAPTVPRWTAVEAQTVTPLEVAASAPQWSPDGMWISFSGPKGQGIGLVRPDGSDWRWLTREALAGYKHAWSPDGTRIAFRTSGAGRQYAVRVVALATGEVEHTSEWMTGVQPPVWERGPEGMRWVCQWGKEVAAGQWVTCALPEPAPAPAPPTLIYQGQRLHCRGEAGLVALSEGSSWDGAWSPDGLRLVCDAEDHVGVSEGGGPLRKLCPGQNPSWSPDGRWIVYQIAHDHTHAVPEHTADTTAHEHAAATNHRIVDSDLWVASPDGAKRFQLTQTPDVLECEPQWSPDGAFVACESEGRVRVIRLATGAAEKAPRTKPAGGAKSP